MITLFHPGVDVINRFRRDVGRQHKQAASPNYKTGLTTLTFSGGDVITARVLTHTHYKVPGGLTLGCALRGNATFGSICRRGRQRGAGYAES